jgi:hypothetical protein
MIARPKADTARLPVHGRDPRLRTAPRRPVPPTRSGKLRPRDRAAFLAALIEARELDAACRLAGVSRTQVIAARARDAMFANEWDRILAARSVEFDMLLEQFTKDALRDPDSWKSESRLRLIVSTARWLSERAALVLRAEGQEAQDREKKGGPGRDRRTRSVAKPAAARNREADTSCIADPGGSEPLAEAVRQLIATGERRLREASAILDAHGSQ